MNINKGQGSFAFWHAPSLIASHPNMAAYLSRLHHISLHVLNAEKIANDLVSKFKFNLFAARLTDTSRQLALRKGAAVFVVNERPDRRGLNEVRNAPSSCPHRILVGKHAGGHQSRCLYDISPPSSVDTVSNVCFEVEDVERSFDALRDLGCNFLVPPTTVEDGSGRVTYSVLKSVVGNVCHTLIDRTKYKGAFLPGFDVLQKDCSLGEDDKSCPITHFDHITYACPRQTTQQVMRWYEHLFGFQRFFIDRWEHFCTFLYYLFHWQFSLEFAPLQQWRCGWRVCHKSGGDWPTPYCYGILEMQQSRHHSSIFE